MDEMRVNSLNAISAEKIQTYNQHLGFLNAYVCDQIRLSSVGAVAMSVKCRFSFARPLAHVSNP